MLLLQRWYLVHTKNSLCQKSDRQHEDWNNCLVEDFNAEMGKAIKTS